MGRQIFFKEGFRNTIKTSARNFQANKFLCLKSTSGDAWFPLRGTAISLADKQTPPEVLTIAAQRLAICNDIGEASYIDSLVAAALVIRCKLLPTAPQLLQKHRPALNG
eukprot:1147274-Pelagomonas_calceolata.AAC.6